MLYAYHVLYSVGTLAIRGDFFRPAEYKIDETTHVVYNYLGIRYAAMSKLVSV